MKTKQKELQNELDDQISVHEERLKKIKIQFVIRVDSALISVYIIIVYIYIYKCVCVCVYKNKV